MIVFFFKVAILFDKTVIANIFARTENRVELSKYKTVIESFKIVTHSVYICTLCVCLLTVCSYSRFDLMYYIDSLSVTNIHNN